MQFIAVASALFAAAVAAPAPAPQTAECPNPAHCPSETPDFSHYENININDFFLRKDSSGVRSVDFKLSGDNVTNVQCATGATQYPSEVVNCGDEFGPYKFVLTKPTSEQSSDITIYHQTGQASGKWGEGKVPVYCHAGGDGQTDMVCNQIGQVTIVIKS